MEFNNNNSDRVLCQNMDVEHSAVYVARVHCLTECGGKNKYGGGARLENLELPSVFLLMCL